MHARWPVLLVCGSLVLAVTAASLRVALGRPPADQVAHYVVSRDGSEIGSQAVRFQNVRERLIVQYRLRIRVDILFVNAYSYDMEGREDWVGDRLDRLTVRTDKNGEALRVNARRDGDALVVRGRDGAVRAPGGAVPAGPFHNAVDRHPSHVIDAETGEVVPARFEGPTRVRLRLGTRQHEALRYTMHGEREGTLWYRPDGVLLRQRLIAADDSVIEFRLR